MIKAIIFDFFGVLVGDGFDVTYRYAGGDPKKDHNFTESLLDQANRGQITVDDFRAKISERLGITPDQYQQVSHEAEQLNYELLDYIKSLRPKYKTAILSNVNSGGLQRRMSPELLREHFDVLVESAELGYIKPEPEAYQLTAEKLGVSTDECVFIDDREGYVAGAEAVGMKGIHYSDLSSLKAALSKLLSTGADN